MSNEETDKNNSNTAKINKRPIPPQLIGKTFKTRAENNGEIDPNINQKGRPKSFDQMRALFQEIASEMIDVGKGKKKKRLMRVQHIGEVLASDKKLMKEFLEFTFGKVPQSQQIDLTSGGKAIPWKDFIDGVTGNNGEKDTDTEAGGK